MIRDYYERQILESEAADAEGEPEDDDGDDEFMEVDVEASEVEQVLPVRIVKHQYYYDNGKRRPLLCVGEVEVQRWIDNPWIRELHIPR